MIHLSEYLGVFSALVLPAVLYAAEPAAQPFPLDRVRLLDGPFKEIQDLHRAGLVGQLEPDRLLAPFRHNAKLPQPEGVKSYGGWEDGFVTGHYAGHYLSAASRMYATTGDVTFLRKVEHVVKGMAECQERLGGGYLSAFPSEKFDQLESPPYESNVPYYTMHKIMAGLLDAHQWCGTPQALEVAGKMSDFFAARIAKLAPEQIEAMLRTDRKANPGNEFGGMGGALTDLYVLSRDRGDAHADRHQRLAEVFNRPWFIEPLARGEDRLDGLHSNTHAAQAVAFARYAVVTRDERTARAAAAFWRLVVERRSFVNGGNSFHEKLRTAGVEVAGKGVAELNALTAESCNTHNMLKLTSSLFELSPSAAYADYYEHALCNHILSTIAPDDGRVVYFTPLPAGHFRVYLDGPYCCQGTGIENAARFGESIYFHHGNELWVNLFIPSTLDWREQGLKLRLETRYPENGDIRLTVEASQSVEAALRFRIPGWLTGRAEIQVNGESAAVDAPPGGYAELRRTWSTGDVVELRLPLALRVRAASDDPATVSLFYGPVLLAGELGRAGMPESDVGGNMAHSDKPPAPVPVFLDANPEHPHLQLEQDPGIPTVWRARMFDPSLKKEVEVRLEPFHRVHHQRYAVYWKVVTPAQAPPL